MKSSGLKGKMKLPTAQYDLGIYLFDGLEQRVSVGDRSFAGTAPNEWDFDEIEDAAGQHYLLDDADEKSRHVACKYPALFCDSLDELLSVPRNRIRVPDRFFLVPEGFRHPGQQHDMPDVVKNYLASVMLVDLLCRIAEVGIPEGEPRKLVFLSETKLEIDLTFSQKDLRQLDKLDEFASEFVNSTTHESQKKTIVKKALHETFNNRSTVSFAEVLSDFDQIYSRVVRSYELYVAEFSYEKVKGKVVKEKLEGISRLNKVLSDIQNQLLAVPIALILIGGQIKNTGQLTATNVMIWAGALVFCIFMSLLLRNQRNTLHATKGEIDQQKLELRSKYSAIYSHFESEFKEVDARHDQHKMLLWIVDGVVALSFMGITIAIMWFSGLLEYWLS